MSVVVAVRVRPFNNREIELNSKLCVKMQGNSTILIDDNGEERPFTFDYSFWSHDGFHVEPSGKFVADDEKYATQQKVFDQVGRHILKNALAGYHCCLFAYGQTGSGKSYSMVGFEANEGIVPIICEEIFKSVEQMKAPNKSFEINFSMTEIYNERVQDLLIPINKRPPGGLKVREAKSVGVYVEGLSKHAVDSYAAIQDKTAEGTRNRTIAATQMNACSSRAHTIITIEFKQKEIIDGRSIEKLSVINLVDLAGSEKVAKSGATGDRLKEGCSINKSLSVLGLVISTLASKSTGKDKKTVVPYRDSSLTRILQNALGGNSKTLMICAVSPSNNNYEESLSTLRYADQAKKIQCHAVINESESDKKIRELKSENDDLKRIISEMKAGNFAGIPKGFMSGNDDDEPSSMMMANNDELEQKIKEYEEAMKSKANLIAEMEKSFEMKLLESKNKAQLIEKNDYSVPHIINLNEDPFLSGKIYHNLEQLKVIYVGRRNSEPTPHIVLQSIGIQPNHARIEKRGEEYFIVPANPSASEFIFLNGNNVTEPTELRNYDRIVFGIGSLFIFYDPRHPDPPRGKLSVNEIDWENCQREITNQHQIFTVASDPAEEKRKQERMNEIEAECERLALANEEQKKKLEEEYNKKIQAIVNEMSMLPNDREEMMQNEVKNFEMLRDEFDKSFLHKIETEKAKKEEITKEFMKTFQEKDTKKLEHKMTKIFPNIVETNLIASELHRNIIFSIHISYFYLDMDNINNYEKQKKYRIKIRVDNNELGYSYFWDLRKFTSRYFMIKELAEKFSEGGKVDNLDQEQDPFWDPPEYQKVGEGFLKLMSLAYLTDNPNELILVGDNGKSGLLNVDVVPTDGSGEPLDPDDPIFDEFVDNVNDLKGKDIYFNVVIGKAKLPNKMCTDPIVKYTLKFPDGKGEMADQTFKTEKISGKNPDVDFNYSHLHCYKNFDDQMIKYLLKSNMSFEVFAFSDRETVINQSALRMSKLSFPSAPLVPSQPEKPVEKKKDSIAQSTLIGGSKFNPAPTSVPSKFVPLPEKPAPKKAEKKEDKKKGCEIF